MTHWFISVGIFMVFKSCGGSLFKYFVKLACLVVSFGNLGISDIFKFHMCWLI